MTYVGFILQHISILIYLLTLVIYILFYFKKEYFKSDNILKVFLLEGIITVMLLSYSLIIMNKSFDINFYINVEFSYLLFIIVPLFIFIEILDYFLRKRLNELVNMKMKLFRYLLPTLCIVLLIINLVIYYFSIHYFIFLI